MLKCQQWNLNPLAKTSQEKIWLQQKYSQTYQDGREHASDDVHCEAPGLEIMLLLETMLYVG